MAPSAGLDKAAVVRAAATLADQVGLDHLTLAQLAAQLNIRTPSLYNHVAGLPGLERDLALLGAQQLIQSISRAAIGRAGDAAVIEIAFAYRGFIRAHPGLYAATIRAPEPSDTQLQAAAQELVEILVAALAAYRLSDDAAIHAVRGLRSIVHGFATLELAGGFAMPLDCDESFRHLVQAFLAGLRNQREGK